MRLMKLVPFALAAVLSAAAPIHAGSSRDTLEVLRSQILADRKALVADNLGLTDAESEGFWKVYEAYQEELNKLRRRRMNVILDYADAYPDVSDEKAHQLLAEHLAVRAAMAQVEASFLPKFEKVLPQKKVARYYQLENKIDAIINYELAAEVPLVR